MVGQQGRGQEGGGPGVCPVLYIGRPGAWERWSVSGRAYERHTQREKKKTTWEKKGHNPHACATPQRERAKRSAGPAWWAPLPQDGYHKFRMVREGGEIADQLDMALMHDIICVGATFRLNTSTYAQDTEMDDLGSQGSNGL